MGLEQRRYMRSGGAAASAESAYPASSCDRRAVFVWGRAHPISGMSGSAANLRFCVFPRKNRGFQASSRRRKNPEKGGSFSLHVNIVGGLGKHTGIKYGCIRLFGVRFNSESSSSCGRSKTISKSAAGR